MKLMATTRPSLVQNVGMFSLVLRRDDFYLAGELSNMDFGWVYSLPKCSIICYAIVSYNPISPVHVYL